jgi:2-oxoglutarate dehydrogenase E2 component (dihydrolipoamide succinyltransferase)
MKDILVPALGESITEATVGKWYVNEGDGVAQDSLVVELETDKVTLEVNAPVSGKLTKVLAKKGTNVRVGDVLANIEEGAYEASSPKVAAKQANQSVEIKKSGIEDKNPPAVKKLIADNALNINEIPATGKGARVTKSDVVEFMSGSSPMNKRVTHNAEERVPMSRLRQKIAERLKVAQNTAAILTTFNEIDMSSVIDLRKRLQESFQKSHGVKLGFMSFFVKACVQALQEIPALNAEIDGADIVFKHFYNIGVAVSTDKGLVVPTLKGVDLLTFADIEKQVADFGARAKAGKLELGELSGGTFSITNGGVFGSLLSTPILNPPQCGILGMHAIQNRPVAVDNKVEIRPMMYVALSYDHRLVDGREAVTFLVRIKEMLEDPERLLLQV